MINTILILLLLHCIGLLFKENIVNNTLCCGLFGYIGIEKKLDKKSFYTLGFANDSRGGDSCGIFIDGESDYGIDKNKLFSTFQNQSKLLKETTKAKIALGHCRKASVGEINVNTAQPVVITNDKGEVDFVLMHNGTLLNHKQLAEKYLTGVPDYFTDSQILAHCIYHEGFKLLTEYQGAGTFIMVDYRQNRNNPTSYIFKGASKQYDYSTEISEERPLYMSIENKGIWFSSMFNFLYVSRLNEGNIKDVTPNTLYCISNGNIKYKKIFDRSNNIQCKNCRLGYKNYGNYDNLGCAPLYDDGDDYYYDDKPITDKVSNIHDYVVPKIFSTICCSDFFIDCRPIPGRITFDGNKYLYNKDLAHGEYDVTKYGYTCDYSAKIATYKIYFYCGVLLYNKDCFDLLEEARILLGIGSPEEFTEAFPEIIYIYSDDPYWSEADKQYLAYKESDSGKPYNGIWDVLFTFKETQYRFVNGYITLRYEYSYNHDKFMLMKVLSKGEKIIINKEEELDIICLILNYDRND